MRIILFILLLARSYGVSAQIRLIEDQNKRDKFKDVGINTVDINRKAGIRTEAVYEITTNADTQVTDSFLISYAEYDSFGNILGSLHYQNKDEILKDYRNTYRNGKLVKTFFTSSINGVLSSSFVIDYNDREQEEYFYQYIPGMPDPYVHKKLYNKKGQLRSIWGADPDSKRFTLWIEYQYLSDGLLKKIKQYPVTVFRMPYRAHTYIFSRKGKEKPVETVYNEQGSKLVSYSYDEIGKCLARNNFTAGGNIFQPGQMGSSVFSTATIIDNLPKAENIQGIDAENQARFSGDNWNPPTDPFTLPANRSGYYSPLNEYKSTSHFFFNADETVEHIAVKNELGEVIKTIRYYYNEKVVIN